MIWRLGPSESCGLKRYGQFYRPMNSTLFGELCVRSTDCHEDRAGSLMGNM